MVALSALENAFCRSLAPLNLRYLSLSGTVESFFGQGLTKKYEKGKLVASALTQEQPKHAQVPKGSYACECGRSFMHGPAFLIHRKFCTRALLSDLDGGMEKECGAEIGSAVDSAQEPAPPPSEVASSSGTSQKLRKDGRPKQSGLREGDRRVPHTIYLKYQVALQYENFLGMKKAGTCSDPLQRTSDLFNGLSLSNIWKWHKQMDQLRDALLHEKSGVQKKRNRTGLIVGTSSRAARKQTLHPGRGAIFPLAEHELYQTYKTRREKGLRVTERWLVITMRKNVRRYYGDDMADAFRGSYGWVWRRAPPRPAPRRSPHRTPHRTPHR